MSRSQQKGRMTAQFDFYEEGGRVRRYHTVDVLRPQTVAEHVYGVLTILMVLGRHEMSPAMVIAALAHDAPESVTGDIPAPTKRFMRQWGEKGEDIIADWENDILMEFQMEEVVHAQKSLTAAERRDLKIADMLEGLRYCQREHNLGNHDIVPIAERYVEYLLDSGMNGRQAILARHLGPDFFPGEHAAGPFQGGQ